MIFELVLARGSIRVDRRDYVVRVGTPDTDLGSEPSIGSCDTLTGTITLSEEIPPGDFRDEVFGHEVGHAIDEEFDLGLSHPQIGSVGRAFVRIVKDNAKTLLPGTD